MPFRLSDYPLLLEIQNLLVCPLTQVPLETPVVLSDGYTYEYRSLVRQEQEQELGKVTGGLEGEEHGTARPPDVSVQSPLLLPEALHTSPTLQGKDLLSQSGDLLADMPGDSDDKSANTSEKNKLEKEEESQPQASPEEAIEANSLEQPLNWEEALKNTSPPSPQQPPASSPSGSAPQPPPPPIPPHQKGKFSLKKKQLLVENPPSPLSTQKHFLTDIEKRFVWPTYHEQIADASKTTSPPNAQQSESRTGYSDLTKYDCASSPRVSGVDAAPLTSLTLSPITNSPLQSATQIPNLVVLSLIEVNVIFTKRENYAR